MIELYFLITILIFIICVKREMYLTSVFEELGYYRVYESTFAESILWFITYLFCVIPVVNVFVLIFYFAYPVDDMMNKLIDKGRLIRKGSE